MNSIKLTFPPLTPERVASLQKAMQTLRNTQEQLAALSKTVNRPKKPVDCATAIPESPLAREMIQGYVAIARVGESFQERALDALRSIEVAQSLNAAQKAVISESIQLTIQRGIERAVRENLSSFTESQCRGCKYYCGQTHNNTRLVCAVHPYGVDDTCPDFEQQ